MSDLIWVAIIAAFPPTLAVVLTSRKQEKKIDAVHQLANDRLTKALERIEKLQVLVDRGRKARTR